MWLEVGMNMASGPRSRHPLYVGGLPFSVSSLPVFGTRPVLLRLLRQVGCQSGLLAPKLLEAVALDEARWAKNAATKVEATVWWVVSKHFSFSSTLACGRGHYG